MPQPWKEVGRYGSVGIEFVLSILIVSWLGHWLDVRYWGGKGWGLAIGFLLGVAVGFRNLIRTAQHMQRDIERAEARDPEAGRWNVDPQWLHPDPGPPPEEPVESAPTSGHDGDADSDAGHDGDADSDAGHDVDADSDAGADADADKSRRGS